MHFHSRYFQIIVQFNVQHPDAHASADGTNGHGSEHGSAAMASNDAKLNAADERPKHVHANDAGQSDA